MAESASSKLKFAGVEGVSESEHVPLINLSTASEYAGIDQYSEGEILGNISLVLSGHLWSRKYIAPYTVPDRVPYTLEETFTVGLTAVPKEKFVVPSIV